MWERMEYLTNLLCGLSGNFPGICPVYYANGNHEQRMKEEPEEYSGAYSGYREALEKAGIHFLENESRVITAGNLSLELCALELPLDTYRKLRKIAVTPDEVAELTGRPVRKPVDDSGLPYCILLAHNPAYMNAYKAWGADLILSGASPRRNCKDSRTGRRYLASGFPLSEIFRRDDSRWRADGHCKPGAGHPYDSASAFQYT